MHAELFQTDENEASSTVGVRINLLGGFRAEHKTAVPDAAWQQRRSAKALVKLLAIYPGHCLHREQILDLLWPEVEFESAVNSFGKALHVARRALEPDIPSRGASSYLRLVDGILSLATQGVWIDIDHFQSLGEEALRRGDVILLRNALARYTGDLLPEDTYESWTTARRSVLADLNLRLVLALADALAGSGQRDIAIEQLIHALQLDSTREDVHCRLMRLYAQGGQRMAALRQYQVCCEILDRELDARPETATVALYEDIREGRGAEVRTQDVVIENVHRRRTLPEVVERLSEIPMVGRDTVLGLLLSDLKSAVNGHGATIMVGGEVGVGKTRLVAEIARAAGQQGALILWGTDFQQESPLPYGPYVMALESHIATLSVALRETLASRYSALAGLIPSLAVAQDPAALTAPPSVDQSQVFAVMVRLLSEISENAVMVLVLDNLHTASGESIQLLHRLAQLTNQRRWLVLGTYCEERLAHNRELPQLIAAGTRQGFCCNVNLPRLGRRDSHKLVHVLIRTGVPSPALLEHIYTLSLGNPLYLSELVGAMQGRGELTLLNGFWYPGPATSSGVPRQVERLVDEQVERMGVRSQRVLSLMALADTDVSLDELCLAVQEIGAERVSETELLDIIDTALASRIIEERGDTYAFRHPLFRDALYGRLSRGRRTQFHGALAHAIESCRPQEIEVLAHHYTAHKDPEKAEIYLRETVHRAQEMGLQQMEESSLWSLLEQLHLLGRREDAQHVREKLATLLQDSVMYGIPPDAREQHEYRETVEHGIAESCA
jgi:DNA-binding SARP family transcriptional activator